MMHTVMIHQITLQDGNSSHADDPSDANGWEVWLHVETPNDPQQPFDEVEGYTATFETTERVGADFYATCLAMRFDADISEY